MSDTKETPTTFDLVVLDDKFQLTNRTEEYSTMVATIQKNLPVIKEACSHFGKTQSQFMDNFLTVSHPTPLRNARQTLAEMNKSLEALREAQYNCKKKQLLIKRLTRDIEKETDEIKREEMQLEIDFEKSNLNSTMMYVEGAVRAVTNYTNQYHNIMKAAGYNKMSEVDFEKEEEAYHIMKAFEQAICAARARGGLIDEGNHIYFSQIGVNGQMAQSFISQFFQQEKAALEKGGILNYNFQADFLKNMATFFAGCSTVVAARKGHSSLTESALLDNKFIDEE